MQIRILLMVLWLGLTGALPQGLPAPLSITRHSQGDFFTSKLSGPPQQCDEDFCLGASSGTASLMKGVTSSSCNCQCHSHLPAYREDFRICVDDIHECALAPFVGGSTSQQIPFVFLPLKGQIIHPSKEIRFSGVESVVCAVSGSKFLTEGGWIELRNPIDTDVPFRLFRDEGRTFLQWIGEAELRTRMSGRLVLVYLMCRDVTDTDVTPSSKLSLVSPCVAFRVAGSPITYPYNVSEVAFFPDAQSANNSDHLTLSEYVAIGICSILLGLIYVASVFLYLHLRKRNRSSSDKLTPTIKKESRLAEEGFIKNNPLLSMGSHYQIESDTTNSDTDGTSVIQKDEKEKITSALVHMQKPHVRETAPLPELTAQEVAAIERLPEENVSIVETLENREYRPDSVKAIASTARRKLYFNPAFFDPHLLMAPPPAAIEFLTKIREVITIAKQKMACKKFSPSLLGIPEEEHSQIDSPLYGGSVTRRSSLISLKRENSRRKTCSGCPGCEPQDINNLCGKLPDLPSLGACRNCSLSSDVKQRSIRKWLEDVPILKPSVDAFDDNYKPPKRIRSPSRDSSQGVGKGGNARICSSGYLNVAKEVNGGPNRDQIYTNVAKEVGERRTRSPARSLPPNYSDSIARTRSPRPLSERAESPSPVREKRIQKIPIPKKSVCKPKRPPPKPPCKSPKNPRSSAKAPKPDKLDQLNQLQSASVEPDPDKEEIKIPTLTKKHMKAVIEEFSIQRGISNLDKRFCDYDTDSLERTNNEPSEYAEVSSSQPSPSLSAALPMEEELTMRNAIFNTQTGSRTISKINGMKQEDEYELILLQNNDVFNLPKLFQKNKGYSLVTEVYVNNGYNYSSAPSSPTDSNSSTMDKSLKIMSVDNEPGKLLIQVEDCADHYIPVEDANDFEPDTLDRKTAKPKEDDVVEKTSHILLKSTGTFKTETTTNEASDNLDLHKCFGSLREIYEAKTKGLLKVNGALIPSALEMKEGRMLSLEDRHSKRQRMTSPGIPPDVIPPPPHNHSPLYEYPKPPVPVQYPENYGKIKPPLPPKNGKHRNVNSKHSHKENQRTVGIPEEAKLDKLDTREETAKLNRTFHAYLNEQLSNGLKHRITEMNTRKFPGKKTHQRENFRKTEDSGYLSTDSSESRRFAPEVDEANDKGSDSDESMADGSDGHSESGAESVETHSVFFGSFRKTNYFASTDSGVDMKCGEEKRKLMQNDDGHQSSDSENNSYTTVIPLYNNVTIPNK